MTNEERIAMMRKRRAFFIEMTKGYIPTCIRSSLIMMKDLQ